MERLGAVAGLEEERASAATSASEACRSRASPAKTSGGMASARARWTRRVRPVGCCAAGPRHDRAQVARYGTRQSRCGRFGAARRRLNRGMSRSIVSRSSGAPEPGEGWPRDRPRVVVERGHDRKGHDMRIFSGIQPTGDKHLGNLHRRLPPVRRDAGAAARRSSASSTCTRSRSSTTRDDLRERTLDLAAMLFATGSTPSARPSSPRATSRRTPRRPGCSARSRATASSAG